MVFIDEHRDRYGVEPICRVLEVAPSTYWARKRAEREPAPRTLSDRALLVEIRRVRDLSRGLYGVRKVWWQLRREGIIASRCVMTWSGVVYVAFVIDAYSGRIVGWKADITMRTPLVLDTLQMALWSRQRDGIPLADAGLIHHHDNGSQYLSFAFTSHLIDAGIDASGGAVGDGYDNALAETTIGLYKTEKIHREGPWRTLADVELATLEWVD